MSEVSFMSFVGKNLKRKREKKKGKRKREKGKEKEKRKGGGRREGSLREGEGSRRRRGGGEPLCVAVHHCPPLPTPPVAAAIADAVFRR